MDTESRPVAKKQAPFRIVPGRPVVIEWDQDVQIVGGGVRRITMHVQVEESSFGNQCGRNIQLLLEMYHDAASQIDGFLASIDKLTSENVGLKRDCEKLQNQLAEARRRLEKNGK